MMSLEPWVLGPYHGTARATGDIKLFIPLQSSTLNRKNILFSTFLEKI